MSRPAWLSPAVLMIIVAGAVMMSVSMGARQSFGLLIAPLSAERVWPLATFSLAVALQNLLWGAFQPFTGAAADRFGAARVASFGAACYAVGLAMVAFGGATMSILGLGIAAGLGMAATSFSVVLGPVGRAVAPQYRASAMGVASAAGSLGMIVMIPVAQQGVAGLGATGTLWMLALFCVLSLPFGLLLAKGERAAAAPVLAGGGLSLRQAVAEAWGHAGYRWLTLGFFVCGFQLAFIAVHLPGYLQLCGMGPGAGATALLVIGVFNTIGTFAAGKLAQRYPAKYVLSAIYLGRAVVTIAFVFGPKNEWTLIAFAAFMGAFWLSTVPPTSGVIAQIFGPKYLGTLFGIVFFSHQIGGFLGAWLGGVIYDRTLSYDAMWVATAVLGVVASLAHLPIRDRSLRGAEA